MKKLIQASVLLASVGFLLASTSASATTAHTAPPAGWTIPSWAQTNTVPEIDSVGTLPAMLILGGVVSLIAERKRNKK